MTSRARTGMSLLLLALGIRCAFLFVILLAARVPIDVFFSQSDAGSYLTVANWIWSGSRPDGFASSYHSRVFLGWPLIFGWTTLLGVGKPGLILLTLVFACLVPLCFYGMSQDASPSLLLCYFTPAWLLHSINPMSEAAYLCLGLASTLLLMRGRTLWAGLAIGVMIGVRPYGVALLLGQLLVLLRRGRGRMGVRLAAYGAGAALFPLLCAAVNLSLYGDVLHQWRMYGEHLGALNIGATAAMRLGDPTGHLGWPFVNLVLTPLYIPTPLWKVTYVYAHVLLLLALVVITAQRVVHRHAMSEVDVCMATWFLLNVALIVCGGPYWGFHTFDRYFVWAWPAGLWLARDRLRLSGRTHAALAAASVLMVAFSVERYLVAH